MHISIPLIFTRVEDGADFAANLGIEWLAGYTYLLTYSSKYYSYLHRDARQQQGLVLNGYNYLLSYSSLYSDCRHLRSNEELQDRGTT